MNETTESGSVRPFHEDCDCEKPVTPGGDYPDDWIPAAIDYAPPEHADADESFDEHALSVMQFHTSQTFDATCMECGFNWPIHVHEDREDQSLNDYDNMSCPHCGSDATVAQLRYVDAATTQEDPEQ